VPDVGLAALELRQARRADCGAHRELSQRAAGGRDRSNDLEMALYVGISFEQSASQMETWGKNLARPTEAAYLGFRLRWLRKGSTKFDSRSAIQAVRERQPALFHVEKVLSGSVGQCFLRPLSTFIGMTVTFEDFAAEFLKQEAPPRQ
jgi:hypothetical protein